MTLRSVLISSTAWDLPKHREEVRLACLRAGFNPREMMENLPALNRDAIDASLRMVEQADVYLCILAYRYGTVPEGYETSITEMEFNRAVELNKPRLVFFIHKDHPVLGCDFETGSGAAKLKALKARIGEHRVAAFFKSAADLRANVVEALTRLSKELDAVEPGGAAQPTLDLPLAPAPAEDDPYRFAFVARKTTFVGRDALLAELERFASDEKPFRWWSVGGEAGAGKSRLALEAMIKLRLGSTWRAGFLPRDEDQGFRWHEWRPGFPTFITVDDASLRIPGVQAMVRAIGMGAKDGRLDWPVRVLLLDRAADVLQLPGWDESVIAAYLQLNLFKEPLVLEGLGEEDALALASEVAGPGNAQAALELLRHGDVESRPLFVSFAADALRTGTKQSLKSALDLTRAFWRRTIETFWIPLGAGDAELDVLCLATLTGGMPIRTLSDPAWSGLGVPQANPGLRRNFSRMYAVDSSGSQEGPRIRPLQPSFAGEVFVLDRLQGAVELGHDPSKGLLRAAWRHSPYAVSGFVQRAFSDLPDHPVMDRLLEAGPEPGDVDANEVWSSCLRACVASRLAVSDQGLALKAFKQLLKLAEEMRTDEILSDAAFTAAALISHLRQEHYELAVRTLRALLQAFQKLARSPRKRQNMPAVTKHRRSMLKLAATIEPRLKEFLRSGPSLPGGLGAAFLAAFSLHESLPSGEARIQFLHLLGDVVRPFASTFAAIGQRRGAARRHGRAPLAGMFLLRSLPTIIDAARRAAEMNLHLSQLSGLTALMHTAASFEAAQREDVETSIAEAKAACDRLSSNEMPEEVAAEIEASLRSVAVYLHRHPAEARCLLIARRQSILASGELKLKERELRVLGVSQRS